jgi:hypothetical protein
LPREGGGVAGERLHLGGKRINLGTAFAFAANLHGFVAIYLFWIMQQTI